MNLSAVYQNVAWKDPLAMINVLFPYFWVLLSAFVIVCFFTLVKLGDKKWLHVLLVAEFSVMLFFTPFLLGGFSWSPDDLWHGGIASYMPQILGGTPVALAQYARAYPLSFIVTYLVEHLFGVTVFTYSLYIYPLICSAAIAVLAYVFASRVFDSRIAFLAMLIGLPSLHYLEPHVSPYSAGTVLVLLSLVLLTVKGRLAKAANLVLILGLIVTHPISPLLLGIYVFSALIASFFVRRKSSSSILPWDVSYSKSLFVFTGVFWFFWTVFQAMPNYSGVDVAIIKVFNFSFIGNLLSVSQWTVGGESFVYPVISQLGLALYGAFLAIILLILAFDLAQVSGLRKGHNSSEKLYPRITISVAAILFAAMGFLLFASSGERFLLGRGLIYFLLMASILASTFFVSSKKSMSKPKIAACLVIVLFLTLSFPVIAYSKEAYNTFTPSAGAGLEFLSTEVDLSQNSLSMGMDQQLAAYANLTKGLNLTGFPPNLDLQNPDIVVMRISSYFFLSMRYDNSFIDNSYTQLEANLTYNPLYSEIYSNSKFEVYMQTS